MNTFDCSLLLMRSYFSCWVNKLAILVWHLCAEEDIEYTAPAERNARKKQQKYDKRKYSTKQWIENSLNAKLKILAQQ